MHRGEIRKHNHCYYFGKQMLGQLNATLEEENKALVEQVNKLVEQVNMNTNIKN